MPRKPITTIAKKIVADRTALGSKQPQLSKRTPGKRAPQVFATEELMIDICQRVAKGGILYKICEEPGYLSRDAFFDQVQKNKEYTAMYNKALQLRGEFYADQIIEDAEQALDDTSENIQARKLIVNTKQWVVSRLLPKKYGDRMVLAGDEENPLITQVVVGGEDLAKKLRGGK